MGKLFDKVEKSILLTRFIFQAFIVLNLLCWYTCARMRVAGDCLFFVSFFYVGDKTSSVILIISNLWIKSQGRLEYLVLTGSQSRRRKTLNIKLWRRKQEITPLRFSRSQFTENKENWSMNRHERLVPELTSF